VDDPQARLLDPLTGTLCGGCVWLNVCGAAGDSDYACRSRAQTVRESGPGVLHPGDPATAKYLRSVGGPEFDTISAASVVLPALPKYLPQLRTRHALAGSLDESIYAVRGDVAIGRRAKVLRADELRAVVGLSATQKLVLVLFCKDDVLERLWEESAVVLTGIAEAGYHLVVAPSYSTWTPRPRTEHLYNLKRSLIIYSALQRLGVPAVPRVAWVTRHDVQRFALWLEANPCVELVAVDSATYRSERDWRRLLDGLELLERLTLGRLRYLINGPTKPARHADVFGILAADRVCWTSATLAPPPEPDRQLTLSPGGMRPEGFALRCLARRAAIAKGRRIARERADEGQPEEADTDRAGTPWAPESRREPRTAPHVGSGPGSPSVTADTTVRPRATTLSATNA
jgi:hypothetical protein